MIPKLMIPRELADAAREEARRVVDRALDGLFGVLQAAILRRQSYAYAAEKAVYHADLARRLDATLVRIVGKTRKIRRHQRLGLRWAALAKARDPRLAGKCGLYLCKFD